VTIPGGKVSHHKAFLRVPSWASWSESKTIHHEGHKGARRTTAVQDKFLPIALVACGLLVRVWIAHLSFLNPDEALHYALAAQPSLGTAYRASLTTVHPPLYILLLHAWKVFGRSELVLRLLSVLSGIGFCWLAYRWLRKVQDDETALVCLALMSFLPSPLALSAEVRQYALLLFFASAALYFLDSAIQDSSWRAMVLSVVSLWLALLTHYSAFIFALALGIYALLRLASSRGSPAMMSACAAGQLGTIGIGAFLYRTHISRLQSVGTAQGIADTWLRSWIFHPRQDQLFSFAFHNTVRLFRYFFGHGTVGVLGLLLVVYGLVWLLKQQPAYNGREPKPFELAAFFALPFVITLAAAIAGKYPYGGTRHDALLVLFAIPAASVGFAHLPTGKTFKSVLLGVGLLVSNIFAVPSSPNMTLKDQKKAKMVEAMEYLRSTAPPGSVIFADHSAGLLLSYYLCHHTVVPFQPLPQEFLSSDCSGYKLITPVRQPWGFQPSTLSAQVQAIQENYGVAPGSRIWLIQAGWINSQDPEWLTTLASCGCKRPQHFGQNILICDIPLTHGEAEKAPVPPANVH
jgi:hypothetical protein